MLEADTYSNHVFEECRIHHHPRIQKTCVPQAVVDLPRLVRCYFPKRAEGSARGLSRG